MAESKTRIYEVKHKVNRLGQEAERTRLVEAASRSAAYAHVAKELVEQPTIPDAKRVASLMASGVKVETAV
jgi:hypothetical protein